MLVNDSRKNTCSLSSSHTTGTRQPGFARPRLPVKYDGSRFRLERDGDRVRLITRERDNQVDVSLPSDGTLRVLGINQKVFTLL
jgi:hypothetical protein